MPNPVFQLILTVAPFPTNFAGNLNDYAAELVSLISASLSGSILPGIYNPPNPPSTYTSDQGPIFYQGQWYYWNASLPTPAYVIYSPLSPLAALSPSILDNADFQVSQRFPGSSSAFNIGPDQWWTGGIVNWKVAGGGGFTIPAVGATRNVLVVSSTGAVAGSNFYPGNLVVMGVGDEMSITAVPDGTHITFTNTGGATPGNTVPAGALLRVRQKVYVSDRWACQQDGTITTPPNQQIAGASILGSRTTNNPNTSNCLRITANSTTVTPSTSQYAIAFQRIERQRAQLLFDIKPSFSIWLRSSLAGTYCAFLQNAGADHSMVLPCVITSTGVWQQFQFPSLNTPPYGSGNWGTNPNDFGMMVGVCAAAGSTFQTNPTNDKNWISGNLYCDTNQTNLLGTSLATLDICFAQLEPAPSCTAFYYLPFQSQLHACQRYCAKSYPYSTAIGAALGAGPFGIPMYAGAASLAFGRGTFPREMRQTPLFLEAYCPSDGSFFNAVQNNGIVVATVSDVFGIDATGFTGTDNPANLTVGNFYSIEYLAEDGLL